MSGLFFFIFLQYRANYEKAVTLSLLYEKEKLAATLEQSQSSVIITNLDATIEYVNQAFVNTTGYSREEIIGQKPSLLKSTKTPRATYEAMWAALLDGQAWQGEVINLNKQGEEFIELTWISPIRKADGTIGHYLAVKENITERKQKDALLLAAKERAENLAKSKSQFLANMSHEIRTPMAAIIGFSDLALLIDMPTKVNEYVKNINSASNHLLTILNDILDMSKIEAGQMALKLTSFKLADLQETVYGLLMNTAQTKGLTLNIDIAPSVPKVLIGDSLRLKQVFINLLGNAIKFTQQGSVTLSISLLELTASEARLLFAITDTGIGISAEQQDNLFQPFSQADDGFDRSFEGTGLGLAISQDLVRLMSGSIKLDSHLGLGSCFSFELVLPLADLAASEPQVTAPVSLNPEPLSGIRVLVAEDNAFNQMFISDMLENFGASTVLVDNGLEALAALEKNHFDIVLMDLHMPAMDGYEATLEIRKRPHYASLPVIAFTASVTAEEKRQCLDSGMNDFVGKPTHKKDLLTTLERWL
jgi:PAS domain S-box-containing protein